MKENLILIGFMGAGKTSVGEAYAQAKDMPLLDTDQMIEAEAGMSISDIFATCGEPAFRRTETAVLEKLLREADAAVISVGGGLPLLEANRVLLKQLGTVVFLRVQPDTVLQRLEGDTTRPLLQGEDVARRVYDLMEYRNPLYESAAHRIVDVDGKTLEAIVAELTGIRGGMYKDGGGV